MLDQFIKIKLLLKAFFISLLLLEIFFQICFAFNIGIAKKPILFFNPYCDESYWLKQDTLNFNSYDYHPLLSLVNKSTKVPNDFSQNLKNNIIKNGQQKIVYGSSFTGHDLFKDEISSLYKTINYAVPSYGLDQIYLSYQLTKNQHYGKTILIGFLLEDIDRSIFKKRDYEKVKFNIKGSSIKISNTPIKLNKKRKSHNFYTYSIFKNIIFLMKNNFQPKNSVCFKNEKSDLFRYFIKKIIDDAESLDQKIIFITFNFTDDFNKNNYNWREDLVNDYFSSEGVIHINAKELVNNEVSKTNESLYNYFSKDDLHLNAKGFRLIVNDLQGYISEGESNLNK
jgi:hypothetical protein